MSLIEDWNDSHLPPVQEGMGSQGPSTGFSENFSAATDRQFRVDSMFGLQAELDERFAKNLEKAQTISGETFDVDNAALMPWVRTSLKQPAFSTMDPWRPLANKEQLLTNMQNFNGRLQKMKADGQPVETLDDMLDAVVRMRQQTMGESDSVGSRASVSGYMGSLVGSAWGSLNFVRDPVLVGSMFAGGKPGQLLASRLLTEFGVNAGAETIQQFAGIRPTRELLGEEQRSPWEDIIVAGVTGAVLGEAPRAVGSTFRSAERQFLPNRARAREFRDTMELALSQDMPLRTPTDAELLRGLETLKPTPVVRMAQHVLRQEIEDLKAQGYNPPLNTRVAQRQTMEEIADQIAVAAGRRSSTAVRGFLPQAADTNARMSDPIVSAARELQPVLYRQLDEAQVRLTEAEAGLTSLADAQANRRFADIVELIDPELGQRARIIEDELDGNIPRARRGQLEAELDRVVAEAGPEMLVRAESDSRIGPRREEQRLRKQKKLRAKEFKELRRIADQTEAKVLADVRLQGRLEAAGKGGTAEVSEVRALDNAEAARPAFTNALKERALGLRVQEPVRPKDGQTSPKPKGPTRDEVLELVEPSDYSKAERLEVLEDAKKGFDSANGKQVLEADRMPNAIPVLNDLNTWIELHARSNTITDLMYAARDKAPKKVKLSELATMQPWVMKAFDKATGGAVGVVKIGDKFVLRDGNHRVAQALARGDKTIDAHVVEMPGPVTQWEAALRNSETADVPVVPDKVDLGEETLVDKNLRVPLDEAGESLTVEEIFKDMADDDAMLQAMKVCAI